jgi:hypothetical protein
VSQRVDGTYRCDRCDADVVNGSIHYAAVIVRQHHWGIACGCANAELDWTSLAAWYTAEGILP